MKKIISAVLLLAFIFTVGGCSASKTNKTDKETDLSEAKSETETEVETETSVSDTTAAATGAGEDGGVYYTNFLRLGYNVPYRNECGNLSVEVTDAGNYVRLVITNNGTETETFGGEYLIQRNIDGEFRDVAHDTFNLIYAGTDINDLPHVSLKNRDSGEEIALASETETVEIAPGQVIDAEFMMMNYEIFAEPEFEGEYRLIYGDISVDFEIVCDVAC